MPDIEIRQYRKGEPCDLLHGDFVVARAGRVEIKRKALELHQRTGDPVYNIKAKTGRRVLCHWKKDRPLIEILAPNIPTAADNLYRAKEKLTTAYERAMAKHHLPIASDIASAIDLIDTALKKL